MRLMWNISIFSHIFNWCSHILMKNGFNQICQRYNNIWTEGTYNGRTPSNLDTRYPTLWNQIVARKSSLVRIVVGQFSIQNFILLLLKFSIWEPYNWLTGSFIYEDQFFPFDLMIFLGKFYLKFLFNSNQTFCSFRWIKNNQSITLSI